MGVLVIPPTAKLMHVPHNFAQDVDCAVAVAICVSMFACHA